MGRKDIVTKDYLKDPVVFADAFNYLLYGGKNVINPESLKERDTVHVSVPYGKDGAMIPIQKNRDSLMCLTMMEDESAAYLMLGIEAQTEPHLAMPVRNMLYDALQYAGQVEQAAASRRKDSEKKPNKKEFLSGFYGGDRLLPVITLVILFATEEWDGPIRISDMFIPHEDSLMEFVTDYKLNLIAPAAMSDQEINRLSSSLREVILYIKSASDEDQLSFLLKENERFKNLDIKAAKVINELMDCNLQLNEEKEELDMCKAIDDMREHAREEGMEQGILQSIRNLMQNNEMSAEQAMQALGISSSERDRYAEKLKS